MVADFLRYIAQWGFGFRVVLVVDLSQGTQ